MTRTIKTINVTKLLTIVLVDVGTIYLAGCGLIDSAAVTAILGASLGYVFGNGEALAKKA